MQLYCAAIVWVCVKVKVQNYSGTCVWPCLILFTLNLPCRFKVTNLTFIISFFKTLSLSLVISTRYQLYKQYCGQCCRRSLFLLGLDYQTAKKTTVESQEANSSLLCLQVELYRMRTGMRLGLTPFLMNDSIPSFGSCMSNALHQSISLAITAIFSFLLFVSRIVRILCTILTR